MFKLSEEQELRAQKLHSENLVFDAHCDTILSIMEKERSLGEKSKNGHLDLPRLQSGGINAQIFAVFVRPDWYNDAVHATMKAISVFKKEIQKNKENIALCRNSSDLRKNVSEGKTAAIMSIEGGEALQKDLEMLSVYKELGVSALGLTWNNRNAIADGALEASSGGGLTDFGVEVINEMEDIGMVVDVAHISPQGFWDVVDNTTKPFIVSHTLPRKMIDTPRNLDADQIKAVAKKHGVIGISFYFASYGGKRGTLLDALNAIDYFVDIAGPDHVGIGSDFDGFSGNVKGLETCEQMINLTRGLVYRGYSDEDIRKILGENFMRVFKEILG